MHHEHKDGHERTRDHGRARKESGANQDAQTMATGPHAATTSASSEAAEKAVTSDAAIAPKATAKPSTPRNQSKGYALVAVVYLLGLFIGALEMGIVTPARTVIQNTLGVEDSLGIWMLTIYTLAYAASIPVMGKLADKYGRKYIYLTCVLLFGIGSLICGLSQNIGNFWVLLIGRAIQAIGGGGIMPVATTEFGTAFPPEKRDMALGLVGGVYGVANVFGSSAGSLILDIFGQTNWQFIFFVNIPICIFIIAVGLVKLENTTEPDVEPIDGLGILDIPKLSSYTTIEMNMKENSGEATTVEISDETLELLENSDVTTVVDTVKAMVCEMHTQIKPDLISDVQTGIRTGIDTMQGGADDMDSNIASMESSIEQMQSSATTMQSQIDQMSSGAAGINESIAQVEAALPMVIAARDQAIAAEPMAHKAIEDDPALTEEEKAEKIAALESDIEALKTKVTELENAISTLKSKVAQMESTASSMNSAKAQIMSGVNSMQDGLSEMQNGKADLADTIAKLEAVYAAVPALFDEAQANYESLINENADSIKETFQRTLNSGFAGMFIFSACCSIVGLILLFFYRDERRKDGGTAGREHGHGHGGEHGHGSGGGSGGGQELEHGTTTAEPAPVK